MVLDLGDLRRQADARDEAEETIRAKSERDAALARAREWDKGMRRAFKGILTRQERYANLGRMKFDDGE